MEHWAVVLSLSAVLLAIVGGLALTLGPIGRRQRNPREPRPGEADIDFMASQPGPGLPLGGLGSGGADVGDGGAGGHGH